MYKGQSGKTKKIVSAVSGIAVASIIGSGLLRAEPVDTASSIKPQIADAVDVDTSSDTMMVAGELLKNSATKIEVVTTAVPQKNSVDSVYLLSGLTDDKQQYQFGIRYANQTFHLVYQIYQNQRATNENDDGYFVKPLAEWSNVSIKPNDVLDLTMEVRHDKDDPQYKVVMTAKKIGTLIDMKSSSIDTNFNTFDETNNEAVLSLYTDAKRFEGIKSVDNAASHNPVSCSGVMTGLILPTKAEVSTQQYDVIYPKNENNLFFTWNSATNYTALWEFKRGPRGAYATIGVDGLFDLIFDNNVFKTQDNAELDDQIVPSSPQNQGDPTNSITVPAPELESGVRLI